MQVHQARCPNCRRAFCFPLEYPGNRFQVLCSRCYVGYHLLGVELAEEHLSSLIGSRLAATFVQKPGVSQRIFQYLAASAREYRFAPTTQPNAVLFLVSQTRSAFPHAVFFQDAFHPVQPYNRLLFTVSVSMSGALFLLATGLSLNPIAIGTTLAAICFWRVTALPKIKGTTRKQLSEEQGLLKQCYEFQQMLEKLSEAKRSYENLRKRQKRVLRDMLQTPKPYPAQIDLYHRSLRCTEDYLKLCVRSIEQYESAIRSVVIQIETSRLSVELPTNFVDPRIEFGLDLLEDQLARHIPPKPSDYDTNDYPAN